MPRDPLSSAPDMIQAVETAQQPCAGMGQAEFLADSPTQWAIYSQRALLPAEGGKENDA